VERAWVVMPVMTGMVLVVSFELLSLSLSILSSMLPRVQVVLPMLMVLMEMLLLLLQLLARTALLVSRVWRVETRLGASSELEQSLLLASMMSLLLSLSRCEASGV
jgi:hypothetical protein